MKLETIKVINADGHIKVVNANEVNDGYMPFIESVKVDLKDTPKTNKKSR